jgi:hypothetical protein
MATLSAEERQRLEKAARIVGINYHHIDEKGCWWRTSHMSTSVYCWDPRENDADAIQLAQAIHAYDCITPDGKGLQGIDGGTDPERVAQVRRAIFDASARFPDR